MEQISGKLSFAPYDCQAGTLVTARSHFIDRMVADCEIIHLPPRKAGGGTLVFSSQRTITRPEDKSGSKFSRMVRPPSKKPMVADKPFLDFRLKTPHNWAHFLNNHLPIFFAIASETGITPEGSQIVLPANIPDYICEIAGVFGLETLRTDGPVEGLAILFASEPWTGIRSIRHQWAKLPVALEPLLRAGIRDTDQVALPRNVFISRRGTRTLENEDEVARFLKDRGYTKIYPEDLSVTDQFRLFEQAENIVAIHGAALAPLLYISDEASLKRVIELFPCGHMTDVYRVMAHQVGCNWIGVRGKIKPEHVAPAYDLDAPFTKYSLQSFEVDVHALEVAMNLDGQGG